jgi:hypothetical protein
MSASIFTWPENGEAIIRPVMKAMQAETLEKMEANRKTDIKEIKEEMKANQAKTDADGKTDKEQMLAASDQLAFREERRREAVSS